MDGNGDLLTATEVLLLGAYFAVLALLAVYGLHRFTLLFLYYRHRRQEPRATESFDELPIVTVQLPLFNEATVVERLLDAVARLDYPRERLEIQVLDDSVDETCELARRKVEELRARGLDAVYLHRRDRQGFKAGALAAGLKRARGEFLAIFDADFVPDPDLLRRTVQHFTDPAVGMVQARWDHLNREYSLLTRLQSLLLDGHFVIEHTARHRSGRCFNFNGTAGLWRRDAIEDAGGWQHDTLTEDLDLSYRAQMRGWRFVYLLDVTAGAELPVDMNAFKTQQHRWAKGAIQTSRKLLPALWRSDLSLAAKIEATFHLTANLAYPLLLALCLMMGPALGIRVRLQPSVWTVLFDLSLFVLATGSVWTFYSASQRILGRSWLQSVKHLPGLMSLGIGLAVNNARAVIEALLSHDTPFVRTPKDAVVVGHGPRRRYRSLVHWAWALEILFGAYLLAVLRQTLHHELWTLSLFLLLFAGGFLYVGFGSLIGRWSRRRTVPA